MNYKYQEKIESIMMPSVDEVLEDKFSYPSYIKDHIDDKGFEIIDRMMYSEYDEERLILENIYILKIKKIQLQYAYDYFMYGEIKEDIYTPQMKIVTLKYLNDIEKKKLTPIKESKEAKTIKDDEYFESLQRAQAYYKGELPLTNLYIRDLSKPVNNGYQSQKMLAIKRHLLSRMNTADRKYIETHKISSLFKRKTR